VEDLGMNANVGNVGVVDVKKRKNIEDYDVEDVWSDYDSW